MNIEHRIDAEDLILRVVIIAAMAVVVIWRDLLLPLTRLAMGAPSRQGVDSSRKAPDCLRIIHRRPDDDPHELRRLTDLAEDAGITVPWDATVGDLRQWLAEAADERRHGHPSLTPEQRNPRGFA